MLPDVSQDLPPAARIRTRKRYREVFELRASAADSRLVVYAAPFPSARPRLGVVVSSRHGGAVARNRRKRLLRAAFRTIQGDIPPAFDYVLIPKPDPLPTLDGYVRSLRSLAASAAARARRATAHR